jgi:hypothetical protein
VERGGLEDFSRTKEDEMTAATFDRRASGDHFETRIEAGNCRATAPVAILNRQAVRLPYKRN